MLDHIHTALYWLLVVVALTCYVDLFAPMAWHWITVPVTTHHEVSFYV